MQEQRVDVGERVREVEFLLGAMRESLAAGGEWLAHRRYPNGPICHVRNVSYMHKAAWGMYAAGVSPAIITEVLDWAGREALQPNGDFYFPEEEPQYQVGQRAYRPLTFLKVAAWLDHPLASDSRVIERIFQYQHSSGGTFNYIGDDPGHVEEQATLGTLNSSFFGHLMVALGEKDRALATGEFLRRFVEANREYIPQGLFYTQMTPAGELITEAEPGQRYSRVVQAMEPKQEFWQTGTTMAYLAVLYEAVREQWGGEAQARPYLEAALELLPFDAMQPLEGYLWPSKCKVGWGTGELLRVLCKYGLGTDEQVEDAYQVARKVAIHTFLRSQLPHGGWSAMHYPLSELDPEFQLDYVPVRGRIDVPQEAVEGFSKLYLPPEELTGEFLGEMEAIYRGMAAYRETLS
jgi:hypothetical protein